MPRQASAGVAQLVWGACASVVLVYILLAALAVIEPGEVLVLTILVVALAAALLAHEWREQFRDER
jgi:ABC-type antimicrobial peptide transport system permease subunit